MNNDSFFFGVCLADVWRSMQGKQSARRMEKNRSNSINVWRSSLVMHFWHDFCRIYEFSFEMLWTFLIHFFLLDSRSTNANHPKHL